MCPRALLRRSAGGRARILAIGQALTVLVLGACAPAGPRPPTVPTAPSVPAATTPGPQPAPPASEPIPARARGAGDATPVKAPPRIHLKIDVEGQYCDFPAVATDGGGVPWVAYVRWDGEKDTIEAARVVAGRIEKAIPVGKPGVIHQPVLAADGGGGVWVIWSQRDERGLMNLMSRRIVDGAAAGEVETLARSEGGNIFPSAASDREGRVWLVWQSQRGGLPDVFCRVFDPKAGRWGDEIRVTDDAAGDWEPRVVPEADGSGAWVVYDSRRGGAFAVWATHVGRRGRVGKARAVSPGGRFEAHVAAAGEREGGAIWIAFERGLAGWGEPQRGRDPRGGLNAGKDAVLARWDPGTGRLEEAPSMVPLLSGLLTLRQPREDPADDAGPGEPEDVDEDRPGKRRADRRRAERPAREVKAVNLPQVFLDGQDRPWMAVRFLASNAWQVALARYEPGSRSWTQPALLPESNHSQDRAVRGARASTGTLWLAWPTLRRARRASGAEVNLASLDAGAPAPLVAPPTRAEIPAPPPYLRPPAPPSPAGPRHTWALGRETYTLLWGDLHRHSDISACYLPHDGSLAEQYRYALDAAGLDFLAVTDHVDSPKILTPYDWWQEQTSADLFQTTGSFLTLYGYERKQNWPAGHRNVIFADRGGPVVYRARADHRVSPWQAAFPVGPSGPEEIQPDGLWDLLRAWGRPVTSIPHTSATFSGQDWRKAPRTYQGVESVVEIYQGARIAYEAPSAPQPGVALRAGDRAAPGSEEAVAPAAGNPLQGFRPQGSYQEALRQGHRLGVVAGSDHLSQRASYGGYFVKEVSRAGILEAIAARRTFAASDKVVVNFSGDGRPLGSAYEAAGSPRLAIRIAGTAPLRRVTLVRNEEDHRTWEPGAPAFAQDFTDEAPLPGENRYYLRIEQADGTMAWSSPLWVTVAGAPPPR